MIALSPQTYPADADFRRQLQPATARRHPGKLHLGFLAALADAYLSPGSTVLDPMAGSGSNLLLSLPPWGCHVTLHELEVPWVGAAAATWAHMQGSRVPPTGSATILQGDARTLRANLAGAGYAAVLTSPPYETALTHQGSQPDYTAHPATAHWHSPGSAARQRQGYDAVVTSPPYLDSLSHQGRPGGPTDQREYGQGHSAKSAERRITLRQGYGPHTPGQRDQAQIGNLRGKAYTAVMATVYAEIAAVVRPGGLVIVVLKNIVRDHKIVDLVGEAHAQLQAVGLVPVAEEQRAVGLGPFHAIRVKRWPGAPVVREETALVLRRPAGRR